MRKRRLPGWGGKAKERDRDRARGRQRSQLGTEQQLLAGKVCSAMCRNCGPGRVVVAAD